MITGNGVLKLELRTPRSSSGVSADDRAWVGARDVVRSLLARCEVGGHFILRARNHVRFRGEGCVRVKNVHGQAIRLTVKPGDNGSAWEYDLVPPTGVDPDALCSQMVGYTGSDESCDEVESPAGAEAAAVAPVSAPVSAPVPAPAPTQTQRSLLARVGELESARARLEERKARIAALDQRKAALLQEIAAIDAESLRIVEEDERDTEAYDAAEILNSLEKLFSKR